MDRLSKMFGAVLVTGARQVGKSTLLEHLTPDLPKRTMDNATDFAAAHNSPDQFFAYNTPPIVIDEIQKAPTLFPEMKQIIDSTKKKGLFYLSGSEQFEMMEQVSESLVGRVGIVNLMGLSLRERLSDDFAEGFSPRKEFLLKRKLKPGQLSPTQVWIEIQRGAMPELVAHPEFDWSDYYGSYVRTYIERDVRKLTQVQDELLFQSFMAVVAARTGQMLNISNIARDVGISHGSAQRWLSILQASGIIYLLRPYHVNIGKRAIKSPKLYMTDTGLAAYLSRWNTPEVMQQGAMAGPFFETFVVGEILKSYYNRGVLDPPLYYYRDRDKREIDLIIIQDGTAHPLEIKKSSSPNKGDIEAFRILDEVKGIQRGEGGVLCLAKTLQPLTEKDSVIPVGYL
ncbi:MAG: ATP-binding protein [Coriobacteriales bacterium]|nr:ATP-binding protein [Coriobacteriales bacterium]